MINFQELSSAEVAGNATSNKSGKMTAPALRRDSVNRGLGYELLYWSVVLGSSALLIWAWALAFEHLATGTTVALG